MVAATVSLPRTVTAETLDALAACDPQAMRSRRDLRRLHRIMGTRNTVLHALRGMTAQHRKPAPLRVLELGAGDGSLMLSVARALAPEWPTVTLTLLDAQPLIQRDTVKDYAALGWTAVAQVGDVFDWVAGDTDRLRTGQASPGWDVIVCNLFLHHFEGAQLAQLLGAIANRSELFFACEPRRAWVALAGSHLIGAIGANAVTRNDAVLSVHAGFRAAELSALWPGLPAAWQVQEYSAGLFSHCFRAERIGQIDADQEANRANRV